MEASELQTVLIVVGVIVLVMAWNAYLARKAPIQQEVADQDGPSVDPMIAKFVVCDGAVIGEVVATEGDALVLKKAGEFYQVPREGAILVDDDVVYKGELDWDHAAELGAKWKDANTKGLDEEVTGRLTTSDDVRAPALEAFQAKQEKQSTKSAAKKPKKEEPKAEAASEAPEQDPAEEAPESTPEEPEQDAGSEGSEEPKA